MKPFNLQEALDGKPIITRDGRKVTEIHYLMTASSGNNKLIAVVDGSVYNYNINGEYNSKINAACDLFMDEPVVEGYINLYYTEKGGITVSSVYTTQDLAINTKYSKNYIKTIKVDNKPE